MADKCHQTGQQPEQPSSPKPIPPQDVVGPAAEPPPPPPGAPAGAAGVKNGSGKLLSIVLGGGTAVLGGLYAAKKLGELDATGADDGGGTGSSIRLVSSTAIQCSAISGSPQSLCVGNVTLDVGNVFGAGTQVCIRTDPSAFVACQVKASSSQLTLRIEERILGCRPTQTGVFVYRDTPNNQAATARLTANIPVVCS